MTQAPNARTPRRRARKLLALVTILALLNVSCNTLSGHLVDREDRRVARNKDGVMLGAEARELGDPASPNAALFVHGFVGAGTNFNQLPQGFADAGWRVRVVRLPGHGTSPRDVETVTADELEAAVLEEIAQLQERHERIVLVGHSMGGALCALAASKTHVDGLVLGGAYFGVTYRWYYVLAPETWTTLGSQVIRWVYKGGLFTQVNDRSQLKNIVSYAWVPTKAGVTLSDLGRRVSQPETLERVTCPVLMFHSHHDAAASPEAAEQAFDLMRSVDKQLVWVDKSNHHVFWDFDRNTILDRSLQFVAAIGQNETASEAPS